MFDLSMRQTSNSQPICGLFLVLHFTISADSNAVLPVCKGETETYLLFVLSIFRTGHEAGSGMLLKH